MGTRRSFAILFVFSSLLATLVHAGRQAQQGGDQFLDGIGETGLVARWALNDGTNTVTGSAGTTVNGTISGTGYTWVTPGAPFDIIINDPPNTPVLVSPANNATDVSTSPTLQATVSDPDGGNLNVTFYGRPVSAAPPPA